MIPYYVVKPLIFNENLTSYSTCSQRGVDGLQDDEPCTSFRKHRYQIIEGFIKYDLTCETLLKHKGRAYGTDNIIMQYILIKEKSFYYNENSDIVILSTPRDVMNKFISDFKHDSSFKFNKIDVDFNSIIHNQYSLGIEGIWLGKIPDINISALLLLGNRIEDSTKYQQFLNEGAEVTNISIIYNFNGSQEKVMITKDGGIILYNHLDESYALLMVEDIYKNLLAY